MSPLVSPLESAIARQASVVMAERGVRAGMLWVGAKVGVQIYRMAMDPRGMTWAPLNAPMGGDLFGMRLHTDTWLPPDVWRLADEHGTLLYDCRQGKVVP